MDKSPNHHGAASPQAYANLLRQSRPAEIIAAARAFINQNPSRPHTPNVNIRQPLPASLPEASRKSAQSSPKSRSISSSLRTSHSSVTHHSKSIQDEIVTVLNGVHNSHDVKRKAKRLVALAQSHGCSYDILLQPISSAVVSLHEPRESVKPEDDVVALSQIFFELVETVGAGTKSIPYIRTMCGVLLQVSECEVNDTVFAKKGFIHCFVKLLQESQQKALGNVENTILHCLKNITLNHNNQVLCGELSLVDTLMERIGALLTNPAAPPLDKTKSTLLTLAFAILRNLATNNGNLRHFSAEVIVRLVEWISFVHDQPKQLLHCARVLAKLAMYPEGLERIEKANAFPELIGMLEGFNTKEEALLVRTLFVLGRCTEKHGSNRIRIGQPSVILRICELLQDPKTTLSLATSSTRLLANLTLAPDICRAVPPDIVAVYQLLETTNKEPRNKELLLNLVAAVTNLSYYWNIEPPRNVDMNEWQERAVHPILPLLFMGDTALLNEGLYALSNLSTNQSLQPRLSDLLVDEAAIILLGYEDLEIARVSCGILTNMAGHDKTKHRMKENMAPSVIIGRIRSTSLNSPQYVTTACQTLFNYLHFHPNDSDALCESDVNLLQSTLEELLAVAEEDSCQGWIEFLEVGNHLLQCLGEPNDIE